MMRGEGRLFFLHLKIYTEVMVFPQAQWKVRVNETDVILIIIQRYGLHNSLILIF